MGEKVWGGVLLGVFVVAVGAEIIRRRNPELAKKVIGQTKDIIDEASKTVGDFTASAKQAFKEGAASVKA